MLTSMRASTPWRSLLDGGEQSALAAALLAMLVIFAACAPPASAPPGSQKVTASPTLAPVPPTSSAARPSPVAGLLGPAPENCLTASPPSSFTMADFGGGFIGNATFQGASPAWEMGLGMVLSLNQNAGPVPYPQTKVMWVVGPNYSHSVALAGRELSTGAPLWFQIYPSNAAPITNPDAQSTYTTDALLTAHASNRGQALNSAGAWDVWGIGIVVLVAGCYELNVSWLGGQWRTVFAAGR